MDVAQEYHRGCQDLQIVRLLYNLYDVYYSYEYYFTLFYLYFVLFHSKTLASNWTTGADNAPKSLKLFWSIY